MRKSPYPPPSFWKQDHSPLPSTMTLDLTCSSGKAVEQADLVVEAIIESLKVKRDLFGFLDSKAQ